MIDESQGLAGAISPRELNLLLAAMGALWGTVVLLATALYKIGARWVETVNGKIAALEVELGKIPGLLAKAVAEHNAEDEHRHLIQMAAIQKNANAMAAPLAQNQLDVAVLRERMSAVEDTDRPARKHR